MGEFHFYGSWNDSWSLLNILFSENKVKAVHDDWYDEPVAIFSKTLDSLLKEKMLTKRRLFILSADCDVRSESFVCQKAGEKKGKFRVAVSLIEGGMELTLPSCYEEKGMLCLSTGTFAYPKEYFSIKEQLWRKPNPEEKNFYTSIKKNMLKGLYHMRLKASKVFVGFDAKNHLENGNARIIDAGI